VATIATLTINPAIDGSTTVERMQPGAPALVTHWSFVGSLWQARDHAAVGERGVDPEDHAIGRPYGKRGYRRLDRRGTRWSAGLIEGARRRQRPS
jgi:hypothetical protein